MHVCLCREHVRDLLGRPAGTASRGLYGLCFDQQGQAYVSNVLQVRPGHHTRQL